MGTSRVLAETITAQPLVFVDIETNGLSHLRGRVIEVAAIRVENGQVVDTFNTLIDPGTELPQFITNLTGIKSNDLRGAPVFLNIAERLHGILDGAIFVAHNVRFDYSFLKQEFKRVGRPFLPRQLCTVKLSRALYPEQTSHKLESLIRRHGLLFEHRHRAFDDAHALWQFLQIVERDFAPDVVAAAVAKQIKQPSLPKALDPAAVADLPTGPGVYIFEDENGKPLYVGKSVNIKKRVLSHFMRDHAETGEFKIAQGTHSISTRETTGELAALLLESRLVKELQPLYNKQLRRTNKLLLARQVLTTDGYMTVELEEANGIDPADAGKILAVYPRRGRARESLNTMVKTFDLCPKLLGLEKSSAGCFLYQLHKCRGACVGKEPAALYNQRLLEAFQNQRIEEWPYSGPVLLGERPAEDAPEVAGGVVIDQWCVLAHVRQEPYCEPVLSREQGLFDLDTYKILRSFLTTKLQKVTIRPLSHQQLQELGM